MTFAIIAFIVGIILGVFVCSFIRGADDKHEECEERYETLRARLCAEVDAREAEIQRLVKGQL
jgi:uncharacterized membrane-anchored protein YhcB (DUF1043 family)